MKKKKRTNAGKFDLVRIPARQGESDVVDSIVEDLKKVADALMAAAREDRALPDIAVVGTLSAIKKLTGEWYFPLQEQNRDR